VRVLLIEDDLDLAATIADYLAARQITVEHAYDGRTGLQLSVTTKPDIVVLDIGLPGITGYQLCESLREQWKMNIPVIMLTARGTLDDKMEGFRSGADDYLVKPFALAELHCRLDALVRRANDRHVQNVITIGDLSVDIAGRRATRCAQVLKLSKLEFDILTTLSAASPSVVGQQELARKVWGEDYVEPETIRSHIYQLRRIIDRPFDKPLIHTIRGFGHAVKEEDA